MIQKEEEESHSDRVSFCFSVRWWRPDRVEPLCWFAYKLCKDVEDDDEVNKTSILHFQPNPIPDNFVDFCGMEYEMEIETEENWTGEGSNLYNDIVN